jgi:hypothetical protein
MPPLPNEPSDRFSFDDPPPDQPEAKKRPIPDDDHEPYTVADAIGESVITEGVESVIGGCIQAIILLPFRIVRGIFNAIFD